MRITDIKKLGMMVVVCLGLSTLLATSTKVDIGQINSSALTSNALIKAGSTPVASSITDNGTTVVTTEPLVTGNTTVLTGNGTTTSATFVPFTTNSLVMAAVPISTTRAGHCDLIWQQSAATTDHPQLALTTSASLTALHVNGSQYRSSTSAVVNFLPIAAVSSATNTAIVAAMTPAAINTSYEVSVDFTVQTNGSSVQTITVEGLTSGGTLTLVAGSTCYWLP